MITFANIRFLIRNSKGVSLPELMIATAIMGTLAVGFMKLTKSGVEGNKRVEVGTQLNEEKNEILGTLSSREACQYTFAYNTNFSDLIAGGSRNIPNIRNKTNVIKTTSGEIVSAGVKLNSIIAKDYNASLKTVGLLFNYTYNINSNVKVEKTKRLDLQLELSGNTLLSCVALAGVQNIDPKQLCDTVVGFDTLGNSYFQNAECQFAKASCEKTSGTWDAVTELCNLSPKQKFNVRKESCENERGYFRKGVEGWSYSIEALMTFTACTENDIRTNQKCYCQKVFRNKIWAPDASTYPAPVRNPDHAGGISKVVTLTGSKFNVVSPIFTIGNPFPDADTRARRVKIKGRINITNVAADGKTKWLTSAIGMYRKDRAAYHTQADWIPSKDSGNFSSLFTAGGYKFMPWGGTNLATEIGSGVAFLNADVPDQGVRNSVVTVDWDGVLQPGDTYTIIVYTHSGGHDILVQGWAFEIDHYTDNTEFGYGPTGFPTN